MAALTWQKLGAIGGTKWELSSMFTIPVAATWAAIPGATVTPGPNGSIVAVRVARSKYPANTATQVRLMQGSTVVATASSITEVSLMTDLPAGAAATVEVYYSGTIDYREIVAPTAIISIRR